MQPFRLLTDDKDKNPVADWDEGVDLEGIECPVSPGHQRAGRRIGPLPRFHFLTDRAAHLILEHELTGGRLLHLDELKPVDGFTPGRLSYWMPDDRARLLGTSLEIA